MNDSHGFASDLAKRFAVSSRRVISWRDAGMPETSLDEATAWLRANRPKLFSAPANDLLDDAKLDSPGPLATYARARNLEGKAYKNAMEEPTSPNILAHSKASESAAKAALHALDWATKANALADVATIKAAWIPFFSLMRGELNAMPIRLGERLGGQAEPVLTEWRNAFLSRLERCAPFGSEDPPEELDLE